MDVTAVVPFYGKVRHLERCVDSLLAQNGVEAKILIIDDCSPEPAPEFKSPQVQVHRTLANRGAFAARAIALAVTTTEWTAVIDHDDWVDPDWLLAMAELNHPVVQMRNLVQQPQRGRPHVKPHKGADEQIGFLLRHRAPHVGLYRTETLRSVGGYSPAFRFGYDTFLGAALREHHGFALCDELHYHRLIRPESLSHSPETGTDSPARRDARERLQRMWAATYKQSIHHCQKVVRDSAHPSEWRFVEQEAARLGAES